MSKLETIKKAYQEMEQARTSAVEDAEKALETAKKEMDSANQETEEALKVNDIKRYLKAKAHLQELTGTVDYYTAQLVRLDDQHKENIQSLAPMLKDIYQDAVTEYKKACENCLKKIEELRAASGAAEDIVKDYESAIGYFAAYIEHDNLVLDGVVPRWFPNKSAFGLDRHIQFQKNQMEEYIKT